MKKSLNKNVIYLIAPCLLLFCASNSLLSTTYDTSGSNNTYYVSGTNTFAAGEYAKGFVKFANGFDLTIGNTTEVAITEAVSGTINLNCGTLKISQDLHLAEGAVIKGPGDIWCVGNASIILEGNATITTGRVRTIEYSASSGGVMSINGNGYSLTLDSGSNGAISLVPNALGFSAQTRCFLKNLILLNVSTATLIPGNSNTWNNLTLEDCTLYMSGNSTIAWSSIYINRNVNFVTKKGSSLLLEVCATYIGQASRLYISPDTIFMVSFLQSIVELGFNYSFFRDTPIMFTDSSSELFLDSCTLYFAFYGGFYPSSYFSHAYFRNGTMLINGLVTINKQVAINPAPYFHYFDLVIGSTATPPLPADNFKVIFLTDSRMKINNDEINMKICRDV
jgi:hypothetical protein